MFGEKGSLMTYIKVIKDMYNGVKTSVRTVEEETEHFSLDVGLHAPGVYVEVVSLQYCDG